MTMCPGTGLLSQKIERGAGAGSCRRGERARKLLTRAYHLLAEMETAEASTPLRRP